MCRSPDGATGKGQGLRRGDVVTRIEFQSVLFAPKSSLLGVRYMNRLVKIAFCAVAVSGFFMVSDADAFGHRNRGDCGGSGRSGLFGGHKGGNDCGGGRGGLFSRHKRGGNDCGAAQQICCEPAPVCCPEPAPVCCPQPAPVCCEAPVASCGCDSGASYGYASTSSYGSDCGCSGGSASYAAPMGSSVSYGSANSGCANCGTTMDAGMIQSGSSIPPAPMADPNAHGNHGGVPAAPSPSDAPSA